VRVSGSDAVKLARRLNPTLDVPPAGATHTSLNFNDLTVPAWVYVFTAPRSYTGDHLVEFHIPGNPLLAQMLLNELLRLGARAAEAGEFTARAYFNGRIDLSEAEGVAATIAAHSEGELRAARQLLGGELARRLRPVMDVLAETLALVEVGIDFSDEDVTFLQRDEVEQRVHSADEALEGLTRDTARFERLAHEPQIVLVGLPNAGKSTLLNALAGRERAVVSAVAGTTRDAVSTDVRLRRGMIKLIDVAGIESSEPIDEIERQMQAQARRTIETADAVVLVHDVTEEGPVPALLRQPDLVVHTKLDLAPDASVALAVSAATGANLDVLRDRLDALVFGDDSARPALALNARHVAAIGDARAALARAAQNLEAGAEVVAFELREALDALGRVLGQLSPDDLLGRIFSRFCIGK
jgi:tRNA modification GTPase